MKVLVRCSSSMMVTQGMALVRCHCYMMVTQDSLVDRLRTSLVA